MTVTIFIAAESPAEMTALITEGAPDANMAYGTLEKHSTDWISPSPASARPQSGLTATQRHGSGRGQTWRKSESKKSTPSPKPLQP